MLVNSIIKKRPKIVESNIISNHNTIKQKPIFFNLSLYSVKLELNSYKIH